MPRRDDKLAITIVDPPPGTPESPPKPLPHQIPHRRQLPAHLPGLLPGKLLDAALTARGSVTTGRHPKPVTKVDNPALKEIALRLMQPALLIDRNT
jgi:hypothetical protein